MVRRTEMRRAVLGDAAVEVPARDGTRGPAFRVRA